jgi:Mg2+-importing ATPase
VALTLPQAAGLETAEVLTKLGTTSEGLSSAEAPRRLEMWGPNAVRTHRAGALGTLVRQFRSPLLLLLVVAATASFFLGERADAAIIGAILGLSIGLGFLNEYRAEVATEALHSRIRHQVVVRRDGRWVEHDVTDLVPGDLVRLQLGGVVPADLRIMEAIDLELDESILTGESLPVAKSAAPVASAQGDAAGLTSCTLMGTVVRSGSGVGVVVATGPRTEFGRIALRLGERQPETEFQVGLRRFSLLLAWVAAVLSGSIFAVNLLLHRPLIDALLFSLAIAVGITPQLLPAVVTTSLATGARRMIRRKVLVKRLVAIEDLGNVEVLFTDKTGTLTEGRITFSRAVDPAGRPSDEVLRLGLACNEAAIDEGVPVGGNPLDVALWEAPEASHMKRDGFSRLATLPFDHDRRMASVLVRDGAGSTMLITKGAPESVLDRCGGVAGEGRAVLDEAFAAGSRVVAVASRPAEVSTDLRPDDERGLRLAGFLLFLDPPKPSAGESLARLAALGIDVKVLTGDNPAVAAHVCSGLGLASAAAVTGTDVDAMDDDALASAIEGTTVFARVSPEQKARIIRIQRRAGKDVGFLGDGVNDAVALHDADVGISVESAVDVARDAADVVLLEKDLGVLADGVVEGRRIFANTMKYVLMGTSSNFGNMFSAAGASAFLKFLPMLPSQVLLNNLLYDASELTIPTDQVDEEQLERPSRWDIRLIERFMLVFGPLSSLFDFVTFALMIGVFHAGPALFRSGWFVESLATQTLVIFVIRTRRTPFYRSRPSRPLLVASLACVAVGAALPFSPFAHVLGFRALPAGFFGALAAMVVVYLALVETAKARFFRHPEPDRPMAVRAGRKHRMIQRRAARYSRV